MISSLDNAGRFQLFAFFFQMFKLGMEFTPCKIIFVFVRTNLVLIKKINMSQS